MREEARQITWEDIVKGIDVATDYSNFKLAMDGLRDKYVPLRSKKTIGKWKWVSRAVTKSRRAKIKAWDKYQNEKTQKNLERYKRKLKNSIGIKFGEPKGILRGSWQRKI